MRTADAFYVGHPQEKTALCGKSGQEGLIEGNKRKINFGN